MSTITNRLGTLDLATLPSPDALETINWEDSVAQLKADLLVRYPEAEDVIEDQLEPLVYLLQTYAAREMRLRAQWNDKVRKVLLATSSGTSLDALGARFNVERMVIQEEDLTASPPVPRIMETDDRFRRRIQLAPAAFATAGSYESYIFHGLSASPDVEDVECYNHASGVGLLPGQVAVVILNREGTDAAEVTQAVRVRLARRDVKPQTADVAVTSALRMIQPVVARIYVPFGPSATPAVAQARQELDDYFIRRRKVGRVLARSGLSQALHRPVVESVDLQLPILDVNPGPWAIVVPGTIDVKAVVLNG